MLYGLLEWMNIDYQLNERATTIQDNTGATKGLYLIGLQQKVFIYYMLNLPLFIWNM